MTEKVAESWSWGKLFYNFFVNYFWVGLLFLLLAIILDTQASQPTPHWQIIGIKILETIGIAVLVAAIFTFASGTSEFVNRIQSLLQDIVINRNFLGNVDAESKRRALAALIKPTDIERRLYANLEDYYDVFITNTLNITKKCVRSDYSVHSTVFVDPTVKRLAVREDAFYRVHPTKDGYDDIQVGFFEYDALSRCEYVAVSAPDGTRKRITSFDWKEIGQGSERAKVASISLNDLGKHHPHLNVELRAVEYGFDHWIPVLWRALQPTDGFSFVIQCEKGIVIKSCQYFAHGAQFHIEKSSEREMALSCHQWFNEGTGVSFVAALAADGAEGTQEVEHKPEP